MSKRTGKLRCIGAGQSHLDYTCNSCGFKTPSPTGAKLHLKLVHGEYIKKSKIEKGQIIKNKCTVCGETFRETEEIKKHMKERHRQR